MAQGCQSDYRLLQLFIYTTYLILNLWNNDQKFREWSCVCLI